MNLFLFIAWLIAFALFLIGAFRFHRTEPPATLHFISGGLAMWVLVNAITAAQAL
jgi:hypothetical protein